MPAPKGNTYAIGNKGGRPTKYKPEYCKEIIKYFSTEPYSKTKDHKFIPNRLPTLLRFAMSIGVNVDTLHEWVRQNKEFSEAFNTAKELYKQFLSDNGLLGLYNSNFAKFIAINTTDMIEKVQVSGNIAFNHEELDDYKK